MSSTLLVLLAGVLAGPACGGVRQTYARRAAADDHGCPEDRVTLIRETTTPAQNRSRRWTYELLVCSTRRTYRYDPDLQVYREASASVGSSGAGTGGSSGRAFSEFRRRQQLEVREEERSSSIARIEEPRFEVSEDEFTGEASGHYRTGVAWEAGRRRVPTVFSLVIDPSTMTGTAFVSTTFDGPRWRDCHQFHMLVNNGERLPVGEPAYRGRNQDGGRILERVTIRLTADALTTLLGASRVRARVCTDVFELTPEAVLQLSAFRERLTGSASEETTPPPQSPDSVEGD
ncbi:hypothetical protein JYT86_00570 [bacterium AH-315-N03]|nr:hypothetical protein [bacterium AH-315-N03]